MWDDRVERQFEGKGSVVCVGWGRGLGVRVWWWFRGKGSVVHSRLRVGGWLGDRGRWCVLELGWGRGLGLRGPR